MPASEVQVHFYKSLSTHPNIRTNYYSLEKMAQFHFLKINPQKLDLHVQALERRVHVVHGLLNDQEITCPICLETVASGEEVCPKENEEKEEYWRTNQPTYIFRWFFPGVLPRRCTQAMWSALRGGWLGLPSFVHHQLSSQTSVHVLLPWPPCSLCSL